MKNRVIFLVPKIFLHFSKSLEALHRNKAKSLVLVLYHFVLQVIIVVFKCIIIVYIIARLRTMNFVVLMEKHVNINVNWHGNVSQQMVGFSKLTAENAVRF